MAVTLAEPIEAREGAKSPTLSPSGRCQTDAIGGINMVRRYVRNAASFDMPFKSMLTAIIRHGGTVKLIPDTAYTDLIIKFAYGDVQTFRVRAGYKEVQKFLSSLR